MGSTNTDVWSALLGRAPGRPLPADADLWERISDRLDPARARPAVREGIERADLVTGRGVPYTMLRSPDDDAAYVRLTPDEADLAMSMDGTRTVAQLVGDYARATGSLAPERVRRVVADLGGGHMLEELPVDAFSGLDGVGRAPVPVRIGRALGRAASGQRYVLFKPDRAAGIVYRFGGRLAFTRMGAAVLAVVGLVGFAVWIRSWFAGSSSATVAGGSYGKGLLLLLGLNVVGLLCHESGHALATKHAGRRVPAAGVLLYFGIPTAFVDTTDAWMASRRSRLLVTAAGPGFAFAFAGAVQLVGVFVPETRAVAFPLGFTWYLNTLFNLNPLMALDGYYLLADFLEVPNLRARAMTFLVGSFRRPSEMFGRRRGEERLIRLYAVTSSLWLVIFLAVMVRMQRDRLSGVGAALWHRGWGNRFLLLAIVTVVLSPVAHAAGSWLARRIASVPRLLRDRRRQADLPRRLAALRASELAGLPAEILDRFARAASWRRPRGGTTVVATGEAWPGLVVVVDGAVEGRRPSDPVGVIRARAEAGQSAGVHQIRQGVPATLTWTTSGTRLLVVPSSVVVDALGPVGAVADDHELAEVMASPALASLGEDEVAALTSNARLVEANPGQRFSLSGPYIAVVGAGSLDVDGELCSAGSVIGPAGEQEIPVVARARSRVWSMSVAGSAGGFGGVGPVTPAVRRGAPVIGVHDAAGPPPPPWGPPPDGDDGDDDDDDALVIWMRRLVALMALLALLAWWLATRPPLVWAEIPDHTAVFEVRHGGASVVLGGDPRHFVEGERVVVRAGDEIAVHRRSIGVLVYRGGAEVVLCARSTVGLSDIGEDGPDPIDPSGSIELERGALVADTASVSNDFSALVLVVDSRGHVIGSEGDASFRVARGGATVRDGEVERDGIVVPADPDADLGCGGSNGRGTAGPDGPGTDSGSDAPGASSTTTVAGDTPTSSTPSSSTSSSTSAVPTTTTTTSTAPTTTTSTTAAPGPVRPLLRLQLSIGSCAPSGPGYTCSGMVQLVFGGGESRTVQWNLGGTLVYRPAGVPCQSASFGPTGQSPVSVTTGSGTEIINRSVTLSFRQEPASGSTAVASVVAPRPGDATTATDTFGTATCR